MPKIGDHIATVKEIDHKIWSASTSFPVIIGVPQAKTLNLLIKRREIKQMTDWVHTTGELADTWSHRPNIYKRSVRSLQIFPHLVTYVNGTITDTGGAHPNYFFDGARWAFFDHKWHQISAKDIFKPGVNWLKEVRNEVDPILKSKGAEFLLNGTVKTLPKEDAEEFVITSTGITFYVNPYDVGPWVQGSFIVSVPFANFSGLNKTILP